MTLEELLDDLSADRDKYNIPLTVSAQYAIRSIVEADDATYLHALPADVHEEVMKLVDSFKRHARVIFLSNLGQEDFTETTRQFVKLCEL